MKTRLQKQIGVDAAWFLGAVLIGVVTLGSTVSRLHAQRAAVDAKRGELSAKEARLTDEISARERLVDLGAASDRLDEANEMLTDESRRISLISTIAQESDMQLLSLRSGTPRPTADTAVVAKSHELIAVGEYRDLAGFIDALQDAEGAIAIEAIQVSPLKAAAVMPTGRRGRRMAAQPIVQDPNDRRLQVSLKVIWLGVSEDFDALQEAKES